MGAWDPPLPALVSPESAEGTEDKNVLTDPNTQEKPWRPVFSARWEWRWEFWVLI